MDGHIPVCTMINRFALSRDQEGRRAQGRTCWCLESPEVNPRRPREQTTCPENLPPSSWVRLERSGEGSSEPSLAHMRLWGT